jgi:hypothetical protein
MTLSRRIFWTGTLAILAVGFTGGRIVADHLLERKAPRTAAAWKENYRSPHELVRGVDAIVLASAAEIRPGRVAMSENSEDSLSFELVDLQVLRGLKGAKPGELITLERAAESAGGHFLDLDGGPFEIGQTYLLFLQRKEDGDPYFYQVNHQGRYRVRNHRLVGNGPGDEVIAHFQNRTVKEGLDIVRASLRGQEPRVR